MANAVCLEGMDWFSCHVVEKDASLLVKDNELSQMVIFIFKKCSVDLRVFEWQEYLR